MMKLLLLLAFLFVPASSMAQEEEPTYSEKRVHFYSGPGLKLAGVLSIPSTCHEANRICPAIVLCTGPGGYRAPGSKAPEIPRKDPLTSGISNWLSESGFVVLRISYRGVGESEGPAYRLIPMEQVEDVRNAITLLQQQKEVDPDRIGLMGLATGGAHASYTAGIDRRVRCMVSVNGMGDLGRWMREIRRYWEWLEFIKMLDEDRVNRVLNGTSRLLEQREVIVNDPASIRYRESAYEENPEARKVKSFLSLESAEAIASYRPESVVKDIAPRAAMWICAENDTLLPVDHSKRMYENAGEPKKLVIVEGADQFDAIGDAHHSLYYGEGFDIMMSHANEWFVTHLKGE